MRAEPRCQRRQLATDLYVIIHSSLGGSVAE